MFIYEKNKRNSETGKLEQTLNITFEGNKPVENPDVIVTKDGITGIKSDSNAYLIYVEDENNNITSISADGEIINYNKAGLFKRYVSWNTSTNVEPLIILKNGSTIECYSDYYITETVGAGEFVIDMENLTLTTPNGTTVPLSTAFTGLTDIEQIYGIQLGFSI